MNHQFRRLLLATIFLLFVAFAYTTWMSLSAVKQMSDHFCRKFSADTNYNSSHKKTFITDPVLDSLRKEKAFLLSRIEAARSDSIVLVLNLPDRIAQLELKGVTLYKVRIPEMHISRFFNSLCPEARNRIFSTPWKITRDEATIPKIPVMVKIAPRDTSEYTPDIAPDTTNRDPVHFALETNFGFTFCFYEIIPDSLPGKAKYHAFMFRQKWNTALAALSKLAMLKPPDYKPRIQIRIPRRDAKIIYRAIPKEALVIVRM